MALFSGSGYNRGSVVARLLLSKTWLDGVRDMQIHAGAISRHHVHMFMLRSHRVPLP